MKILKSVLLVFCFFLQPSVFAQQTVIKDITYKITPENDSVKLDLYFPTNHLFQKTPLVVFIHGGAWVEGNKDHESIYYMRSLRDTLRTRGYAIASINYRLVNKNTHLPAPVIDCKDAVRWIRAHAGDYNFDTENIGLWGGSAGAHLALLIGYTGDDFALGSQELQAYSTKVNYIVDNFGPTDLNKVLKTKASPLTKLIYKCFFRQLYDIREKLIIAMTSYDIKTDKKKAIEVAKAYSPIEFVTSNAVPTLIMHGTKDFVVPFKESKKLKKALDQNNVDNKFVKVKKGDHGFNNISKDQLDELIQETVEFIEQNYFEK
ncbi:alpha/beta hydrolase [Avrilella dinanensis]|uniref:BD-FAE-like domain-containing protein n=1 Tax=Avrilella dinanensis TaxID=2008672 RepID=A0A2M9R2V1_9FLAO|nr:alpha/beta hydrolase [Avrilella dinanensis]PJR03187.1 hypothetical protein CDL10_00755 [Avrilella dinanensis]